MISSVMISVAHQGPATQAHTELADTPGTGFRDECLTLVAEARYGELLDRWLGQFEMLLSRAQDKGARLRCQHQTACEAECLLCPSQQCCS